MIDNQLSDGPTGSMRADPPVIFVDADNTLWDTDKVFADAQIELLRAVEDRCKVQAKTSDRLIFIRSIDQALAVRHHLGLRYPARLLIIATSLVLLGISVEAAAKKVWAGSKLDEQISEHSIEQIQRRYFEDLAKTPPLLTGVKVGLSSLRRSGVKIVILTEGHKDRVRGTAVFHEVMQFVDKVIEAKKDRRLFERVLRLVGNPKIAAMIGDQLASDIIPAAQAGLHTIYIPGGFRPKWEDAEAKELADFQLDNFLTVPEIFRKLCRDEGIDLPQFG